MKTKSNMTVVKLKYKLTRKEWINKLNKSTNSYVNKRLQNQLLIRKIDEKQMPNL